MKAQTRKTSRDRCLPTQFAPDVEFELTPVAGRVFPDTVQLKFQELQDRLVEESLHETPNPRLREKLHRAANEAAALAWTTPYPLLVMPLLFQEKARLSRLRLEKQNQILMRTELMVEAVNDLDG